MNKNWVHKTPYHFIHKIPISREIWKESYSAGQWLGEGESCFLMELLPTGNHSSTASDK